MFNASKPSRREARTEMRRLANEFSDFYVKKGYLKHPSVLISSGIDRTVYFVGSHISVLKPYLLSGEIPAPGYVIVQDCIRTHNLTTYRLRGKAFNWASFFTSMGLLSPPHKLRQVGSEIVEFLRKQGIRERDIRLRISSMDADLVESCSQMNHMLEIDTRPATYYKHTLGFDNISGRNYNICLKSTGTETFEDIGNVIQIEKTGVPIAIELALGSSTVLKQIHGLSHVLECFDITGLEDVDPLIRRNMEDAILVSLVLYHEGLRPGQSGKRRLLGQYLKTISYYRITTGLEMESLRCILASFEESEFASETNFSNAIIEYIMWFESKPSLHKDFFANFQ